MAKKIKRMVKIQIQAGKASVALVGQNLAPHGLNIGEFCQKFNEATKEMVGFTIPAEVTIYEDRSYAFKLKTPVTSELIKKAAGVEKGAATPNKIVAKITKEQLQEIAKKKMEDLNTTDIEQAMKVVAGTAKNMGIEVVG